MTPTHYYGFGLRQRPEIDGRSLGNNTIYPIVPASMRQAKENQAQPFRGITANGQPVPGLYPVRQTGIPAGPIVAAANRLLEALDDRQRQAVSFPIDTPEWQRWSNISPFVMRHGLLLDTLDERCRELAMDVPRQALSAAGYQLARDIMKLNYTIGEITNNFREYGDWVYWLSIMGQPSESEAWGWQIDGHHLNLSCFILGDQMVLTPMFMGSEPVIATTGKYAGTTVLQAEQDLGLRFMQTLDERQQRQATLEAEMPEDMFAGAFRDNLILKPQGVPYVELAPRQQAGLVELIGLFAGRLPPGHDRIRLDEIRAHLDETLFAWIGPHDDTAVFYYRIQSPVVLIEFDHQRGIAFDNNFPSRNHIHTLVRTPNGGDYGKDLLRQHHQQHRH